MKKNIKYGFTAALLSMAAFSFNSCGEEWLDVKPLGRPVGDEVVLGGFEAKVFGLYASLREQGGVSDFTYVWTHCIRADDNEKGSTAADAAADGTVFNNFGYVATNGHIRTNWTGHYKIIYDANAIINSILESGDTASGTLTNLAEAKALRAFCFFELRRDYGEIPLNLKTIKNPTDEIMPKSTVAQVDAQIMKDLTEAAPDLPLQWTSVYKGRLTKGMANSLMAKLYLYQGNYAKALEMAEVVINSGAYQLNTSYDAEFTKAGNNSSESIFEVQKTFDYAVKYTNTFYESQGVRGSGIWDLGWGFNVPSADLVNAYEPNDLRKKTTILTSGGPDIYNTPGYVLPAGPNNTNPVLPQQYWNGKAYTLPSERIAYAVNKNHWEDIKLMRYADVILIASEAALQTGNLAKATAYLNQIRNRAGLPNITATLAAIKQERRVEFAMEFERFYDLVRWNDAVTVLASKGYQDKHKYFPIPQDAIDKAQGVLVQNPNY